MKWARATIVAAMLGLGTGVIGSISSGCSSSATGQGAPAAHAEQVIGAQGGDVAVPDGTGVNIPAGALPAGVNVTVSAEPDAATPSGGRTVSTPYVFGPEGQKFDVPVTVTLAFDPTLLPPGKTSSDIFVYTAPAGTTAYEPLVTTLVDATHISAQVMHFSVFCGFVPNTPPNLDAGSDASAPEADSGSGVDASDDASPGEIDSSLPPDDATTGQDGGSSGNDGGMAADAGDMVDASAGGDSGSSGGGDGGVAFDDAGAAPDASTGGGDGGSTAVDAGSDGGLTCDPQTRWPAMDQSPFSPPSQYAGVDWQNGATTVDQAMTINCSGMPATPQQSPNDQAFTWGQTQDVYVEFNPQTRLPILLSLQNAYTGTLTLFSRNGGAYGNHTYVLGVGGAIQRDGTPFTIDWVNGPAPAVTELYDAFLATIIPGAPAAPTDCQASGNCLVNADDGSGDSIFGFRSDPNLYVVTKVGTSTITSVYTFFKANGVAADGGTGSGGSADASVDATTMDGGTCLSPQQVCSSSCGLQPNGCGQFYQCAPCAGDGGATDSGTCTPIPMATACQNVCGGTTDGCGGKYDCPCDGGTATADGGSCVPLSGQLVCSTSCGLQPNGCGQFYQCAPCAGDGGTTDSGTCTPIPMATACQNVCGGTTDGCGGKYDCPCDGGTTTADSGTCVSQNVCALKLITCGTILDNCGNLETCGPPCDGSTGTTDGGLVDATTDGP